MKYEAVIFDLDGVVCKTDRYHYLSWKKIADRLGVEFNREINRRLRGVSRMESLEIILEQYEGALTIEEKEALASEKNAIYREMIAEAPPDMIVDGVEEVLSFLREAGIRTGLSTSSKNAELILSRTGLTAAFDVIIDGNDITRAKPDPQVFLKAADALGISPDRSLVVEDAASGVAAAHAGRMDVAIISSDGGDSSADYTLGSIKELENIMDMSGEV